MKPAVAQMDFVTFKSMSSDATPQQPIREATQRASGRHFVADLRYVHVARVAMRLSSALQLCAGICAKDCVCHGRGILLKKVQIHAPVLHMLMGCCRHGHRPSPITLRPDTCSHGSRTNIHRLPPAQGSGSFPYRMLSEVVFSRQLQPPNCDHAPTGLEELIGLVDLEGTVGVECIAEDFAVGNRAEDDAVGAKDVVHGQDAGAGVSGIRDPAHGLAASSSMHSARSSTMGPDPSSAAAQKASLVVCGGVGVSEVGCSDPGMAELSDELC